MFLYENNNDEEYNNEKFKNDDIVTIDVVPYIFQNNNTKDKEKNDKSIVLPENQIKEFNDFLNSLQKIDSEKKRNLKLHANIKQLNTLL